MSQARLVVTAVLVEGRPKAEVARTYGLSRTWVHELVARYQAEGDAGLAPRSRCGPRNATGIAARVDERTISLDRTA